MRYIIADPSLGLGWGHIFSETDPETGAKRERERFTRFVFDLDEMKLIHLDIDSRGGMVPADAIQMADLQDSLVNANSEALEDPDYWGLIASNELPRWCREQASSPAP